MNLVPSARYRANMPSVVFEAFDDETVLINLDSGNYYSFCGSGALLWELITSGQSILDIVAKLQSRFPDASAEMDVAIRRFTDELVTEGLINQRNGEAPEAEADKSNKIRLTKFEKPTLLKYSDMAELLLLDPIHEVDETGWPRAIAIDPNAKKAE
jgi:Coenzyme PQQ synthesis protein D (PqqD)